MTMAKESGFWQRAETLRKNNELTQKEVAFHIGVSPNTWASWVQNGVIPSGDLCVKIAKELDATVEYLVTGEEVALPDDDYVSDHGPPQNGMDNTITILASPRLSRIVSKLPRASEKQISCIEYVLEINEPQKELTYKDA